MKRTFGLAVVALLGGVFLALTLENFAAEYGLGPAGEVSDGVAPTEPIGSPTESAAAADDQTPTAAPSPATDEPPDAPGPPSHAEAMITTFVWDGDTIELRAEESGEIVTTLARIPVRLLGVDTPEIESQQREEPSECFGDQATKFLRDLMPVDSRVLVDRDRSFWDDFERRLFYVWLEDGTFVNYEMVAQGYGEALRIWPNVLHWDLLREAQEAAARADLGMWGACSD